MLSKCKIFDTVSKYCKRNLILYIMYIWPLISFMTFREAKIYFEKFPEIHEKTHVLVS